jgi:hypothetical protein
MIVGDLFTVDPFFLWRPHGETRTLHGVTFYSHLINYHYDGYRSTRTLVTVLDSITVSYVSPHEIAGIREHVRSVCSDVTRYLVVLTPDAGTWLIDAKKIDWVSW